MKKQLSRLPSYLRRFEMRDGLRLAVAIEGRHPEDRGRRLAYRVPGLDAPVYLRQTVIDHSIFWQCLVMQ